MSKTKISEYSATANSNTDVGGINIDEGCAPSGINDAIRTLMAQLKNFQTGASGDSFNGPIGTTTAAAGAFTSITASGDITINNGNADGGQLLLASSGYSNWGVDNYSGNFRWYYNTTEKMRLDNAGNLGIGVSPSAWDSSNFKALEIPAGSLNAYQTSQINLTQNAYYTTAPTYWAYKNEAAASLYRQSGGIHSWHYAASGTAGNSISFTQAMTLDASGNLGIGTTSPLSRAHIAYAGDVNFRAQNTGSNVSTLLGSDSTGGYLGTFTNHPVVFYTNSAERARIDSSGNLLVGATSGSFHTITKGSTLATAHCQMGTAYPTYFYEGNAYGQSAAGTLIGVSKNNSTGRSINAGGTINASGADYAEYMTKSGDFTIAKGDVVGINSEGKLTNVFADAVSFVVKSTDPSYVGGDTWGSVDELGIRPNDDASQEEKDAFEDALEAARQNVDRIAFSGQVPVNVTGATAGQYIVPTNNNGAIVGVAVNEADMTLSQYMKAVGKVIAIEQDGRAKIIVKVA